MKKKEYTKINVVVAPEIIKKLEDGNYNRSKLVDKLLSDYFKKIKK